MEGEPGTSNSERVEPSTSRRESISRSIQARQVAVNFMPSRQLPHSTLRRRRHNSEHNGLLDETDAAEGEEDGEDHVSEEQRAEYIVKELEQHQQLMEDSPFSEELRREALRDLPQGLTMKRTVRAKLSASVSLRSKRRPISWFKRTKYRCSFAWKRTKERIRDAMFSIELWYEAIRKIEGQFGSAVGSYFRMVRRLFLLDLALSVLLISFIVIPQTLHDRAAAPSDQYWGVIDWITGKASLQSTLMYYGHYSDGDVGGGYYMPYAYFFTMLCAYLLFFAILCYRTADSYRRNFIETSGGLRLVFANRLFCGWDFGVVSAHAAHLNARSIYNELKELLAEQNKKTPMLTFWGKVGRAAVNITVSVLVLGGVGGALFGLWILMESQELWEIAVTAILTTLVSIAPLLFQLIGRLERYSARTALYVSLTRAWLLDSAALALIFAYWARSGRDCWETRFGHETYRLVLLDAVVSLVVLPGVEIFRALLYKFRPSSDPPEFNIAYNSLTLIYNQSVLWYGLLFSPLLALAVTIKFLFLFYIKRECATRACQPARKVWRAAQTQTVLSMLVTLSLFATLFTLGSLYLRTPSQTCGPFVNYPHALGVLSAGVLRLPERDRLAAILAWVRRPGVLTIAVVLLGVLVYYMRSRALAQRSLAQLLRRMLRLQARDKDFLLRAIENVASGEWLYSPKPETASGSHTARFEREVRKPSNSSYHLDARLSRSFAEPRTPIIRDDGDTDSSFSWQGSRNNLNGTP